MIRAWISYFRTKFGCQDALKNNPDLEPTERYPNPNPTTVEAAEYKETRLRKVKHLCCVSEMQEKEKKVRDFYNDNISKN